ncbi:MAG: SCO family protein [Gemmatimonadetes bacterium]|nr:SCO family protein [Gemmatimonadota bacterium]
MPASRLACAALLAAGVACAGSEAPLHGVVIDPPQEVPAIRIADAAGITFDLDGERGRRAAAVFFGYTHCPDICPATLADWARAKRLLGAAADGIRWVFVSIDPARDTPEIARNYAEQFDSSFVGLAPTVAQLDSLKQNRGFAVTNETSPGMPGYSVAHPAGTFVVDRAGRIRLIYPPNTHPADMAADLRRIE